MHYLFRKSSHLSQRLQHGNGPTALWGREKPIRVSSENCNLFLNQLMEYWEEVIIESHILQREEIIDAAVDSLRWNGNGSGQPFMHYFAGMAIVAHELHLKKSCNEHLLRRHQQKDSAGPGTLQWNIWGAFGLKQRLLRSIEICPSCGWQLSRRIQWNICSWWTILTRVYGAELWHRTCLYQESTRPWKRTVVERLVSKA